MVFGHPGHPGLNAARHVVEENPEEEDHAVKEAVVECLAQEQTINPKLAMNNAVVS